MVVAEVLAGLALLAQEVNSDVFLWAARAVVDLDLEFACVLLNFDAQLKALPPEAQSRVLEKLVQLG